MEANWYPPLDSGHWQLCDGMGFLEMAVWWESAWPKRPFAYEGLDLREFADGATLVLTVFKGFRVVSPVSGVIVGIFKDFLAETVWIQDSNCPDRVVLLGHVCPTVAVGEWVCCGDVVGDLSYVDRQVPLHLHLSVLSGEWQRIKDRFWAGLLRQNYAQFIYPTF